MLCDKVEGKHPQILLPDSHIALLIVDDFYLQTIHGGLGLDISRMRENI